ncbi:MAG: hypothetical protein GY811_00825 [Myxococcales bacterium]|nr:hypothetical protein [Myxococcales bacterium]
MCSVLRILLLASSLPLAVGACGDNATGRNDASVLSNNQLSVLTPPGDSIGLDFSGSITLRVQLIDSDGQAIGGQAVEFGILETGDESASGSSLSAVSRPTNAIGIAEVDLVAGAERGSFRVEAKAPNASSVLFYIRVSDQGFTDVSIATAHTGPRDPSGYDLVELRIFDDQDVTCDDIEFSSPPESFLPSRTQQSLGEESEFRNLAVGTGYTIIAWAQAGATPVPHATGCVHIAADRLRSGSSFGAVLPVADSPYQLPATLALQTDIAVAELGATLTGARAWSALACPLGRSQILLDCLADAQSPDGTLDCEVGGTSTFSDALDAQRATEGVDGCRPGVLESGEASIDSLLDQALTGWPNTAELSALTEGRSAALGTLRIGSELREGASGSTEHRLISAEVEAFTMDLLQTDRPVLAVLATVTLDASATLGLASHSFTLRYGEIAEAAYEDLALAPANVSGLGATLGTEFIGGVVISGQSGCTALESYLCTELNLAASCVDQCALVAASLDTLLGTWLLDLESSGLDYRFAMQSALIDADLDLIVDSLSAEMNAVTVELTTDLQSVEVSATVIGEAAL